MDDKKLDINQKKNRRSIILFLILLLDIALIVGIYINAKNHNVVSTSNTTAIVHTTNKASAPSTTSTSKTNSKESTASKSSGKLTNTGPGDFLGIFVTSVLLAASLHYLYVKKTKTAL
ncbi:MAG: hypothetical protein WCI37_00250 [bacterium]